MQLVDLGRRARAPACFRSMPLASFFFAARAALGVYTLSLHDALPISRDIAAGERLLGECHRDGRLACPVRSEEHTSELQSRQYLVCRLLLEKKKEEENSRRPAMENAATDHCGERARARAAMSLEMLAP